MRWREFPFLQCRKFWKKETRPRWPTPEIHWILCVYFYSFIKFGILCPDLITNIFVFYGKRTEFLLFATFYYFLLRLLVHNFLRKTSNTFLLINTKELYSPLQNRLRKFHLNSTCIYSWVTRSIIYRILWDQKPNRTL